MSMLSRESLLRHLARPVVKVDVPALGETVCMREMSAGERLALGQRFFGEGEAEATPFDWNVALLAGSLCDEQGSPFFADEAEARAAFADGRASVLEALVAEANRVNAMGKGAVESAEKNSETTLNSTSPSSLPTA